MIVLVDEQTVMPPSIQWFGSGLGHSESYLYFAAPEGARPSRQPQRSKGPESKPSA
jgi:hypothetical protein